LNFPRLLDQVLLAAGSKSNIFGPFDLAGSDYLHTIVQPRGVIDTNPAHFVQVQITYGDSLTELNAYQNLSGVVGTIVSRTYSFNLVNASSGEVHSRIEGRYCYLNIYVASTLTNQVVVSSYPSDSYSGPVLTGETATSNYGKNVLLQFNGSLISPGYYPLNYPYAGPATLWAYQNPASQSVSLENTLDPTGGTYFFLYQLTLVTGNNGPINLIIPPDNCVIVIAGAAAAMYLSLLATPF
jgi:hypothetical protein